jgi:hypothetical protein
VKFVLIVTMGLVGCKRSAKFEVPDEYLEGLSENARHEVIDEYAEGVLATLIDWGWEEVEE